MRVHSSHGVRLLAGLLITVLMVSGVALLTAAPAEAAVFTPGDVVVTRVGDGSGTLGSAATAVFLDEYTPLGTLVQSIPLPTATSGVNRPLTMSGSASSEGALALSSDRRYLSLAGYGAAPGLPSVVSTPASTTPRVIARVDATGSVDTTTALTDQPSGNNVRGSVTDDGSRFWVTGAAGGVRFAPLGATTSAQVTTTPTNTRAVTIADGQLYISSGSTPFIGVSHVGIGLPATTATATLLAGATSPYGFVFLDRSTTVAGVDSLYVADDSGSPNGGIRKYSFDGTTWTQQGAAFHYGASDASTTIDLGNGAMVVGDDETNQLRVYDRTHSRYPAQSIDLRAAGLALRDADVAHEIDIEASARSGNMIYWLGSHGQNSSGNTRPNRQELFATTVSGTGPTATLTVVGSYQHLRDDMIAWDQNNGHGLGANALGLAAAATRAPEGDGGGPTGFNIEGAELSPDGQTLYVAFRGPLVGGKALVVPVTNIAALVTANPTTGVTATFGAPLQWDLGGRGIREIRKNASNSYLLITGPSGAGTGAVGEFRFYSWNGVPASQPLLRAGSLDQVAGPGKPESIVSVPDPLLDTSAVQVLTDSGDTVFYGDGVISKDLAGPDQPLRKATSVLVPVGAPPVCSTVPVSIGSVQGTGDVSPRAGQTVTVRGTVVTDYEGPSPALRGFYLQDAGDGDNATSDGIFVFDNGADLVDNGAVVSVTGSVAEFQGQT